jgi:uncharacterized repeat protein (TIGR01451 family)
MKKAVILGLALLLPTWGARAEAQANSSVVIQTLAEVEVKVKGDDGKETLQRQPAKKVPPGVAVIYTVRAENQGAKPADDVVVTDPIPEHMDYVDGSATTTGTKLTFSADGGKTWAPYGQVKVTGKDGVTRTATAEEMTHIRWKFEKPLAPGESRSVEFRARVE